MMLFDYIIIYSRTFLFLFVLVNFMFFVSYTSYVVWYGNILFDIVHNIIENILPKHKNM